MCDKVVIFEHFIRSTQLYPFLTVHSSFSLSLYLSFSISRSLSLSLSKLFVAPLLNFLFAVISPSNKLATRFEHRRRSNHPAQATNCILIYCSFISLDDIASANHSMFWWQSGIAGMICDKLKIVDTGSLLLHPPSETIECIN